MRTLFVTFLLGTALVASGCYHAVVVTGQEPSSTVVEKKWVLGFVNGLVIPEQIDVEDDCPNGVARVETRLSFMNQVATFFSGGVFSPMTVEVTCAVGPAAAEAAALRGEDQEALLSAAAARSLEAAAPVVVQVAPRP